MLTCGPRGTLLCRGWGAFNPMMMMGPGMFGGAPGANGAPGGFGGMGRGGMPNMMGGMGGMGDMDF